MNEPYSYNAPPQPKRRSNALPIVLTVILSLIVLTLTITDLTLYFIRNSLRRQPSPSPFPTIESMADPTEATVFPVPDSSPAITPSAAEEPTSPPAVDTEDQSWADYYADVINALYLASDSPDDMMYDIYDLNSDGIPELFVSEGTWHTATVSLFTYSNGTGKQVDDMLGSYGTILYHENTGILIDSFTSQGKTVRCDYYLEDDTLKVAFSCSDNMGAVADESMYEFIVNGEYVTQDEYERALKPRAYEDAIELGRNYSLTE